MFYVCCVFRLLQHIFLCLGRLVPYGYLLYNKYPKLVDCTKDEVRAKIKF